MFAEESVKLHATTVRLLSEEASHHLIKLKTMTLRIFECECIQLVYELDGLRSCSVSLTIHGTLSQNLQRQ